MSGKRKYVVTGIHPVLGNEPGRVFEAVIPDAQELLLIQGGAIARVTDIDGSFAALAAQFESAADGKRHSVAQGRAPKATHAKPAGPVEVHPGDAKPESDAPA